VNPGEHAGALRAAADDIVAALTRARGRADALDPDLAGVLVFDLDVALERASSLLTALSEAADVDLHSALEYALALDVALDRALDLDLTQVCQRDVIVDLKAAQARSVELAVELARAAGTRPATGDETLSRVGRLPRGLVGLAARVLPPNHRVRYDQEFRAELAELPCKAQLRYALRQLARCWQLRHALAEAVAAPKRGP
jgi:hypothetical protein